MPGGSPSVELWRQPACPVFLPHAHVDTHAHAMDTVTLREVMDAPVLLIVALVSPAHPGDLPAPAWKGHWH